MNGMKRTGNEEDIILEQSVEDKKACMRQPHRLVGEYYSMYVCVLSNLGFKIPFILFESKVL